MELLFKPDWHETKSRYLAWWNREGSDRCLLSVTAPLTRSLPVSIPAIPSEIEDQWFNLDYLKAINEFRLSNTFFGGEALPIWNPGYPGWANLQSYLGAEIELRETTVWSKRLIFDEEIADFDFHSLFVSPENPLWLKSKKMHKLAVNEAKGKSLPGILNLGGPGDILAHLRGSEALLIDLTENPEYISAFIGYLTEIWINIYEELYNLTREGAEGSTTWFELWSPERYYALSCDISYMISPKMFQSIFLPGIERQAKYLKHSVYHVDGVGSFAHVDSLCSIPEIQALQILPGEGKPSPLYYLDVLKKVQLNGKNLHITLPADQVEAALQNLSSRGLCIQTKCNSREEAEHIIKLSGKYWH